MISENEKYKTQHLPLPAVSVCDEQLFDLTLFAYSFNKETASELLQGLAPSACERAQTHLAQTQSCDAGKRQAQLVLAFGPQTGFAERLNALFRAVGPALQKDIFHQLPSFCQTAFVDAEKWRTSSVQRPPSLKSALAGRLGSEAVFRASSPWLETVSN